MKLQSALFASLTTCSILKPLNDITTNEKQALFREQVWQPNFPIPISRNKRDLIGFNRQTNNIFSHQRNHSGRMGMKQWNLCHPRPILIQWYSGNDIKIMMQNVVQQERRAVRTLMFEEKEQAILNRIRYLKQQCICWFICRGEYRPYSWRSWIWSYNLFFRSRGSMQRIDGSRNKTCQGIVLIFWQSSTLNTLNVNSLSKLSM